ncbi:MAG: DUF2330 domain-containing protein [Myxococcota bacterium]
MKYTVWSGVLGVGMFAVAMALPSEAEACGGTFCDAGPQAMPVDQTGENILFAMGETTIEAHIQIQYDPDTEASEFAWVVPVTQIPAFEVSSDQLFINVLNGTVPSYGFTSTFEGCGDDDGAGEGGGPIVLDAGGPPDGGGGGPKVVFEDTVGAFDVVVLQGGTAQEVMDWLAANSYEQDPEAQPILEEYLAEGYLFAAFRLTNGAEVAEIHPISLIFDNDEACIPLRLTRIAAQEDMDVRTFFLADNRVVPQNYQHVLVNPLRLDWNNLANNYKEVITLAVDADEANGRAFVTEYAGPSDVVAQNGLFSNEWDSAPFAAADPTTIIDLLEFQGLVTCFEDGRGGTICDYDHTLIRGLLAQYLPVPAGIDEGDFYGCLSCYAGMIDMVAWDGTAFGDALQERIIDPGQHAVDLLDGYPTLTRMYTTISPGEMTEDPFFYQNADLPDVDLTNQLASRNVLCEGGAVWTLPDGREVYAPSSGTWPTFPDELPWEEEVQEIAERGGPISLVDNTELIDTMLFEHNCQYDYPSVVVCSGEGATGGADDTGTGGGGGGDAAGDSDTDGQATGGSGGSASAGLDGADDGGGCGCSATPRPGAVWGLALLGLLGLRRRRKPRSLAKPAAFDARV